MGKKVNLEMQSEYFELQDWPHCDSTFERSMFFVLAQPLSANAKAIIVVVTCHILLFIRERPVNENVTIARGSHGSARKPSRVAPPSCDECHDIVICLPRGRE